MSRCKSPKCNAPTARIKTVAGNIMYVNPGAVIVQSHVPNTPKTTIITPAGKIVKGTKVNRADANYLRDRGIDLTEGFVPHWITCKDPNHFRKPKKG